MPSRPIDNQSVLLDAFMCALSFRFVRWDLGVKVGAPIIARAHIARWVATGQHVELSFFSRAPDHKS